MRREAYFAYAAVAKDEAQRSIRPFYEAVKDKACYLQHIPVESLQ